MHEPPVDGEWARAWAALYDDDDTSLDELVGQTEFGRRELEIVLKWKLEPRFWGRALRLIAGISDDEISSATRRAFEDDDDLRAIERLTTLPAVGIPIASAILTAQDPNRYTVADFKALASLHALRYLEGSGNRPNWRSWWLPYLDTCRFLSSSWGMSLRDADRALWAANGDTAMPSERP